MELKDRELALTELALRWWNRKSIQERIEVAELANFPVEGGNYNKLTSVEIEWIWDNQPYDSDTMF